MLKTPSQLRFALAGALVLAAVVVFSSTAQRTLGNGFLPHGYCFTWIPGLLWLHVVSDALIALAYLSIPATLFHFVRRRPDVPFGWVFALFGIFIVACGTTNDSLGHAGGDDVLKEFGARLKGSVRDTDLAARLAGDEFVVLLEGLEIEDDAAVAAQKVVSAMRMDFQVNGAPLSVTTSLGVGFSSDVNTTAPELMACADRALYEAKRDGRNGFKLSSFGSDSMVSTE